MCNIAVAPLVGAWIEIPTHLNLRDGEWVAPLVGAWIEILNQSNIDWIKFVAPLVGAWIEIDNPPEVVISCTRRSSRGSVD